MNEYIEVAVYTLKGNVTEAQFLAASDATMANFRQLDGFQRRELSRSEDGRWLDLVYYDSKVQAEAAESVLTAAPTIQTVMQMLDLDTGYFFHVSPVRQESK